ncbi:2-desacetyl-2-hydroxyethyl bacteriochlorophyllide A dehydrogenase [Pedobacter westerhofensis]|uniref:2-desacetyl-2-hydroxyethyl bacteriochlorophyllide A dehydrogenase n=1 Tax=Pedobacter westerhofensis TaxID=425512 RepID=A0A521F655_9SPHI|nr:zinc-binding alcohol dehydrogenase family protein [Pedobacter westerhofensis]SMO91613.1 2-desacetyl-2-hydroxyethyl bacteriochlorophyllide A dehydrogenase [Pedobacter westerhofensis]
MKTLICNTPGEFEYTVTEMPVERENYSLLKVLRVGICGTDIHAYEGTQPFFNYPRILGHEIAAEIVETKPGSGFGVGDIVTISPYFYCGRCVACRNGKTNCCVKMEVFGVHIDGGMRGYISVPDYALVRGEGLTADELVLVEPLAIGAHGVRRAGIELDEFVLVMGAGPIGLGTMEFAAIAGGRVIAMDVNPQRLEYCKDTFGIPYQINPLTDNVMERLMEITNGDMPTVVMDCTGNLKAINSGVQYLAHGGRYVLIGLQKEELVISHPEFHKREATLMSSRNALPEDFEQVVSCIRDGSVTPDNYITHKVEFDELKYHFSELIDPANGAIKAVVVI